MSNIACLQKSELQMGSGLTFLVTYFNQQNVQNHTEHPKLVQVISGRKLKMSKIRQLAQKIRQKQVN